MSGRNSVNCPKMISSEELKALLTKKMRGSAFSVDTMLVDGRVMCHAKFYDYQLSNGSNEILIRPKWNQMWFIGVVACAILGLFMLVPFVGVVVIGLMGNAEYSEFKRILKDALYNDGDSESQHTGNSSETKSNHTNPLEQLEKLAELKEKNLISEEDYEKKKASLLDKI